MPLRFTGARHVRTGNNTVLQGATAASVSFWLHLHPESGTTFGHVTLLGAMYFDPFGIFLSANYDTRVTLQWQDSQQRAIGYSLPRKGATYHIAATFDGTTARLFVNGTLVASSPAGAIPVQSPKYLQLGGAEGRDLTLDDPVIWQGYALTESDILALRDRTAAPEDIAPGNIVWRLTFDGTPGAPATLGDPGLDDLGSSGADIVIVSDPAPIYEPGALVYETPRVRWAGIGTSGKTLALLVERSDGTALDNITALTAHPTISINGGAPIQLANPLWGADSSNRAPYVAYPLPALVAPSDTVTITVEDGWAGTATGSVAGLDAMPVTNGPARSYLPPFVVEPKTMSVGYNLQFPTYYHSVPIYANTTKHASGFWGGENVSWVEDADGYPISITGGVITCQLVSSIPRNPNYPPDGIWTLRWDGAVAIQSPGAVVDSSGAPQETGNWLTCQITREEPQVTERVININIPVGARNIRFYPPDAPADDSQKFHPELLRKLAGTRCIRFMDAMGTNHSNVTSAAHFKTPSARSYATSTRVRSTLTTVGPADISDGSYGWMAEGGWAVFQFTTAAPHGFVTGQLATFSGMSGPIALADGRTFNPNNYNGVVRVLSPTSFAVALYTSGSTTTTVVPDQAIAGTAVVNIGSGMPPSDMAELCNQVGADAWVNVPHALDDAGVTALAQILATTLAPGLRCRVEYSNEPWNTANAFEQGLYFYQMGNLEGIGTQQWYAKRAGQVHALFAAAFAAAGRPGDIIRFFNTQASWPDGPTRQIVDYCAANSIPIDEIGIAPYIGNGHGLDGLDIESWMDLSELSMVYDGYDRILLPHAAILHEKFPAAQVVCYEGGPEYGGHGVTDPEAQAVRSREWSRHPRLRGILLRFLQQLQDQGCALFVDYTLMMRYAGDGGRFVWPAYTYWNQPAGLGDGSDGQFDNRISLEAHDQVVSVIGGAIDTWEYLSQDETTELFVGDLVATAISSSRIDISWGVASGGVPEYLYQLEVSNDGEVWVNLGDLTEELSYSHTGLTENTTYYYRVSVKDSVLISYTSEIVSGTTLQNASSYSLSGPSDGYVGLYSSNFTISLGDGYLDGTIRITPSDNGAGGTFKPTHLDLTNSTKSGTFRYVAVSANTIEISSTNTASLNDPSPISYIAAENPENVIGTINIEKDKNSGGMTIVIGITKKYFNGKIISTYDYDNILQDRFDDYDYYLPPRFGR